MPDKIDKYINSTVENISENVECLHPITNRTNIAYMRLVVVVGMKDGNG